MQRRRTGIWRRTAAMVAVVAMMAGIAPRGAGIVATQAQAADSPTAAITPADAVFYGALTYDPADPNWNLAAGLYGRSWAGEPFDMLPMTMFGIVSGTFPGLPLAMPEFEGSEVAIVVTGALPVYRVATWATGYDVAAPALDAIGSQLPELPTETPPGAAYLIAAPDPAAATMFVDSALYGMAGMAGGVVETSDYHGVTINAAPPAIDAGFQGYAYAVVGEVIVISTHAETIQAFIDVQTGAAPAITSLRAYQTALTALPADRFAFGLFSGAAFAAGVAAGEDGTRPLGDALAPLFPTEIAIGIAVTPIAEGLRFDMVDIPADGAADTAGGRGGVIVLALRALLVAFGIGDGATAGDNPEYAAALALLPAAHDDAVFVDLSSVGRLHPGGGGSGVEAPAECGNYPGRDAAQAAFDADPAGLAILDSNGNGTVCDDYMGQPVAATPSGPGITSLTMVSYVDDGLRHTSAIVRIG